MPNPVPTQLLDLIPDVKLFRQGQMPFFDWLSCLGNIDEVIIYSQIFWPKFVECFDLIFLAPIDRKLYDVWIEASLGNKEQVQRALNHRHIADMFTNSVAAVTREKAIVFGGIVKDIWSVKLTRDFPGRVFEVCLCGEDSVDVVDIAIVFFERQRHVEQGFSVET